MFRRFKTCLSVWLCVFVAVIVSGCAQQFSSQVTSPPQLIPAGFKEISKIRLSPQVYGMQPDGIAAIYENNQGKRALLIGRMVDQQLIIDAWSYMVACRSCGIDMAASDNIRLAEVQQQGIYSLDAKELFELAASHQLSSEQSKQLDNLIRLAQSKSVPVLLLEDRSYDQAAKEPNQAQQTKTTFFMSYDTASRAWYVTQLDRSASLIPSTDLGTQVRLVMQNASTNYVKGVSIYDELKVVDNKTIPISHREDDISEPIIWINDLVLY